MKLSAYCMQCMINRQMDSLENLNDEELKSDYMQEVLTIISEVNEDETAPITLVKINKLHMKYFGSPYSFEDLKIKYNQLMLQREHNIWNEIQSAEDGLLEALKYARIGNYIDFGAMGNIDDSKLNDLLDTISHEQIDQEQYQSFRKDLNNAEELVYLTDNCGEIVLDKLLIRCIKEEYSQINITVIVSGDQILNDATMEDAKMVGLTEMTEVIDNGTDIAGTSLKHINKKAKDQIDKADLIISKGQGNFETLNGCGLNVYYLFLCKCDWFVRRFGMERYKGVFINDKNLNS